MRGVLRVLILVMLSVGTPSSAFAEDVVVDPGPNTPAGTQYQIPLDTARQDAAPKPTRQRRVRGSTLQSENGYGSSSIVPGAAPAAAATQAAPAPAPKPAARTHRRRRAAGGTSGASGGGSSGGDAGSGSKAPPKAVAPAKAPASSAEPPTSSSGSLALLLGALLGAVSIGAVARRGGRAA